ncbi:MAG TPA: 1-deoxy-D-xylulose-5-phosphate reductoisomerase [Candidatus Atribacteria bacterium]|nr:1-deoxy-D-xylulose-5-phosphate reductoisomerase [Candidatus Atribacteria bacterium]HPT79030.1 1-deoxy-D-xylulose-5-phosphate reductoisomerase [Candidatus Atribacteria bacterium]
MKKIAILGSTGSIGTQALDIIRRNKAYFKVSALTAYNNIELLKEQIEEFRPERVGVVDAEKAEILKKEIPQNVEVLAGHDALKELASQSDIDMVLVAVVGIAGLEATMAALESGNDVALANKETLVTGGQLVIDAASKTGSRIIPVDSEHSAIFQCLQGADHQDVRRIVLTASGGPFRGLTPDRLVHVRPEDALIHPNWSMGKKVTIDSATLMNKGLEIIEAKWLFNLSIGQIQVIVHPQSIIHSMVEFKDGSVLAQLGMPDMRIPILYAFSYPRRFESPVQKVDFAKIGMLTFEEPDTESFPCLNLAIKAAQIGGTMPTVLNAANEVAVDRFLNGEIKFTEISLMVQKAMDSHQVIPRPTLADILRVDKETRRMLT